MAERPKPENQPPPIAVAVEATGSFAKEGVENDGAFKEAVSAISNKLGGGEKALEAAKNMVKSGVGMAMSRIGLLPAFSNPSPEARREIVEKIKKDNPEAEGLEIYESWDVNSDPNGFGLLNKFEDIDLSKISEKGKEAKDEQEKAQIEIHLEAAQKGWSLAIKEYKKQLQSASGTTQQLARAA